MHSRKTLLSLVCIFSLMGCQPDNKQAIVTQQQALPDGIHLVNVHKAEAGKVSIPYRKYKLDNGLTLVLHQDKSDPMVHVDVTYHVGSAREEVGKSGFAHFYEHMMFQGSEHVGDDEHMRIVTEAGGSMNGTTNKDRTNYYETVPSNQLEKMLWLESDRMGFLLNAVTQEKFEIQRATVKNERGQSIDNQPYGLMEERSAEALYPVGHPYSWQTIGYVEDLDRVTVNDLKAFFKRWYGPNNAVLTIGGDIDVSQTLQWVKKYFGSIPRGPEVDMPAKQPVKLDETRYVTLEDRVHLPLLRMTFPTVYARHEDEAPLDVLADILGGGKTSLFYKNLVKQGVAVNAWAGHPCDELACEFELSVLANPAKVSQLSDLQKIVEQTLTEFEERGVQPDDLKRTKTSIESGLIFALQSVRGKVSTLAANETFTHEPDRAQYDIDRYNKVTAQDVMRVYQKYIKNQHAVVLSIVPKGMAKLAAHEATFEMKSRDLPADLQTVKTDVKAPVIHDDFDRSIEPQAGPAKLPPVPDFWQQKLDNGMVVAGFDSDEVPIISFNIVLEGGPLLESSEDAGLAAMTADLMNEATASYSNEEMSNQLALIGSSISFSAAGRNTIISVSSLTKHLDKTLTLLQEKLFHPAFLQQDFDRIMQQKIQSIEHAKSSADALASRAVSEVLLGNKNRVALPDEGTLESLSHLTLDKVKGFYQRYYNPTKGMLIAVGAIDQKSLLQKLDFIKNWQGEDYDIPAIGDMPPMQKPVIYLVDKPGAAQSVLRVFKHGLTYDGTGEYFRANMMNFALGSMFNSRINMNLREEHGYSYGAWSRFSGGKYLGRFSAGSSVKIDNTGDALKEMLGEINLYQSEGMTEQELAMTKSAYTQNDALRFETPGQKVGFIYKLLSYGLDKNISEQQLNIIKTIGRDELNAVAAKELQTSQMQIVVVGDKQKVLPQLQQFDRPVEMLDVTM
ncbi:M16 family metallopeptidase [Neptunicella marina]|uniref:Insulinase family protein n=1 Tax=Neptunicella marina TaxID=2125989 RepID=A0A8J6IS11_9ALTE|nr:pitrilysin family protein [Neptunicella marina]MBC3764538.1 insulinase family protein [Neptunicella marina]